MRAATLFVALLFSASPQEKPAPSSRPAVAASDAKQERLARFAGKWRSEGKFFPLDGAAPMPHVTEWDNRLILGGRFLQLDTAETIGARRVANHGLMGYDRATRKLSWVAASDEADAFFTGEGTCDEKGELFELRGDVPGEAGSPPIPYVLRVQMRGADEFVWSVRFQLAGKEHLGVEAVGRRAR
ncbi:MAG TPA: DUF1579 family protein [Planctomycetota bacterium]|nr:DUF1579 family protein [Planctomycetota bacterium]